MNRKSKFVLGVLLGGLLISGGVGAASAQQQRVLAFQDDLLKAYDDTDRIYTRLQVDTMISYFHQRMEGEAIVEQDYVRYIFDADTGKLLESTLQWRDVLPDKLAPEIPQDVAEGLVIGEPLFSKLYVISPKSEIFALDPVPTHPCWVVRSLDGDYILVTIIDAITGQTLGYGTPPPYEGLSIHGPDWGDCPQDPIWYSHANNARSWFETMGYTTLQVGNASDATVAGHIQSDDGAMFYELDHGGYSSFHNQCNATIYATEVESWIANYASMPFAFIGSCEGLCNTGDNTFSYEFRKGFSQDTVTVGYCGMSNTACDTCWGYSISWQTALFDYMDQGYTAQQAFNHANAYYPTCAGTNNCMRIAGDTGMRFVPNVRRSYCGSLNGGTLLPYYLGNNGDRSAHIRCNITASGTYGIYILPNAELVFLNDSEIIATNSVYGSSGSGPIRLVSEQNRSRGMEMSGGGQLRMSNGGQIKVYE